MNLPVLQLREIQKTFRKKKILENVSFNVNSGEILALMGTSGSGKSTLLKIILGLYATDKGNIYDETGKILKQNELNEKVGYVAQENLSYEDLTIKENLIFFASLYDVDSEHFKERKEILLELVHLKEFENERLKNLSGGMKRRVELIISLIHSPRILILDEPFTGLDIKLRRELWNVIRKIKENGVAIIIVSHFISEIETYASRFLFMKEGNLYSYNQRKDLEKAFLSFIQ